MTEGIRFNFWMSKDLKARLEHYALTRGETQGSVARDAITSLLAQNANSELEQKHGELGMAKRIREMMEALPKDTHDGVMLVARIDDVIRKQIDELRRRNWLLAKDYDHFIRLVEDNKQVVETYAEGEWLTEKLNMLVEALKKEQEELEAKETLKGMTSRKKK